MSERQILIPFNRKEAISLKEGSDISGRCIETMRIWADDGLGRKIGGRWALSLPALLMRLDGQNAALKAYWRGDRTSDLVRSYFERAGVPVPSPTVTR